MGKKSIHRVLLSSLFGVTIIISSINSLMMGFATQTFFPAANCLIVGLIWLYRGFDLYFPLFLAIIVFSILIVSLIRIVISKKIFIPAIIIYLLDLITSIIWLISSYGYRVALSVSGVVDFAVILLILSEMRHKRIRRRITS